MEKSVDYVIFWFCVWIQHEVKAREHYTKHPQNGQEVRGDAVGNQVVHTILSHGTQHVLIEDAIVSTVVFELLKSFLGVFGKIGSKHLKFIVK